MARHDRYGMLCKCMSCAAERQADLEREARLRYTAEFQAWQTEIDYAERAVKNAKYNLGEARAERQVFLDRVRQEILDERG